jgi:hypothetical protein
LSFFTILEIIFFFVVGNLAIFLAAAFTASIHFKEGFALRNFLAKSVIFFK